MEKTDYEDIRQKLTNVRHELSSCHDDSPAIRQFEQEVQWAIESVQRALTEVDGIVKAYDNPFTGEPEYHFQFYPEKGEYAYVATRSPGAHANTAARIFTREPSGYGLTTPWPTKVYDYRKYPPKHPPVLEYKSGFNGEFYRIFPDFGSQTVTTLQERPEVDWR